MFLTMRNYESHKIIPHTWFSHSINYATLCTGVNICIPGESAIHLQIILIILSLLDVYKHIQSQTMKYQLYFRYIL